MADSKITALTAISTVDPAADPLVIVDVSDTSMAASGTTKKATINQLLGASGTATLASASITGDLTVDTSTLKVDSANDRVGIGTATPAAKLIVRDGANRNLLVASDATQLGSSGIAIGGFTDGAAGYAPLSIISSSTQFGISGATAMTLNSTGNLVLKGGTAGANGVGITFPTTQVASSDANCLDDYEEGTWTPIIVGDAPVGTGTYSFQAGRYTKIGNRVFVEGYIAWTAHTGGGSMSISGLPYNVGTVFYCSGSVGDVNNIALTAGNTLALIAISASAQINMKQLPTGGGASANVPLDTNANISFSICYSI